MYSGLRLIPLERKSIAASLTPIISLAVMTQKVRILGYLLRANLIITQGAGAVALPGSTLSRYLQSAVVGKRIRATGRWLDVLGWMMRGADFNLPYDVPAAAGVYRRTVELVIPIADMDAANPLDTAAHARMFSDETLDLAFADFASVFGANTTITGQLKPFAIALPGDAATVATPTRINYADFNGGSVLLPRGTLSHAAIFKEDGTPLTSAEISSLTISVDGEVIAQRLGVDDIANLYNFAKAKGTEVQRQSASVPDAGEELNSEPGAAAGASDVVSVDFLPLVFPTTRYSLSHVAHAEGQVQVDYEGSATAIRIGYRQLEEQGPAEVAKAAAKQGVGHLKAMRSKTSDGIAPPTGRLARLLPKQLGNA
jgi:hypothetical protein